MERYPKTKCQETAKIHTDTKWPKTQRKQSQKTILTGHAAIIKHADRKEKHPDRNPNTPTEHGWNHKHLDRKLTEAKRMPTGNKLTGSCKEIKNYRETH